MFFKRTSKLPDGWFHRVTKAQYPFTPDIARLQNLWGHWIFICDDLKTEHRRHKLLSSWPTRAEAITKDSFAVWVRNLGAESYPIPMVDRCARMPYSRIQGELYFVPTSVVVSIDNHRRNGVEFQRTRVDVRIPHKKLWLDDDLRPKESNVMYHTIEASMWIGRREYWDNLLDGGLLFGTCTFKDFAGGPPTDVGKYYDFTAKDYFSGNGDQWLKEQEEANERLQEYYANRAKSIEQLKQSDPKGALSALRSGWRRLRGG